MLKYLLLVAVFMVQMAFAQQIAAVLYTVDTIADSRDGEKYKVVRIGSQVWMAENLNFEATGSKCYENKQANCDKYGRLYNWAAAKSACPSGWHLPTKEEWDKMTEYIGGEKTEGKFLKAKSGWDRGYNGTDNFGFAALPGGDGFLSGKFGHLGYYGNWWSATRHNKTRAYARDIYGDEEAASWGAIRSTDLCSVRCIKD